MCLLDTIERHIVELAEIKSVKCRRNTAKEIIELLRSEKAKSDKLNSIEREKLLEELEYQKIEVRALLEYIRLTDITGYMKIKGIQEKYPLPYKEREE